jgi:endonuclease/exonuclease/phosphatase family metal-dependent hydrolase
VRILKFIGSFFLVLIFGVGLFYFWAKSATLPGSTYAKVIVKDPQNTQKRDTVFSIVTYNIGYLSGMTNNLPRDKPKELFDKNLQLVLKETKKLNPDFMAFQEIDYNSNRSYAVNQQNEIAKLGFNYTAEAINWDKTYVPFPYWPIKMHFGKVVSGQSVLSKFPIKKHQRVVLHRVKEAPFYRDAFYLERLAQVVEVTINDKAVIIINVHLESFDAKTRAIQFDEVCAIFDTYKKSYPTILLGDFNSEARNKSALIQKLFNRQDVGNAAFNSEAILNTFNSATPFKRIDYIFYTKNSIDYLSGSVLTQFGEASDHLPIEMKFRLK